MLFDRGAVGAYNPADLLSGDRVRITRAVRALWESGHKWLKVFKDGKGFSTRADVEAQISSDILLEEAILAMEMNKELSDHVRKHPHKPVECRTQFSHDPFACVTLD